MERDKLSLEERINEETKEAVLEQDALDKDPVQRKITLFSWIAWIAVIVGFLLFVIGGYFFFNPTCSIQLSLNELGDYLAGAVGGFWALAGLFFIYIAFLGQMLQLKTQKLELKYSKIEVMSTRLELMGQKEQMVEQNATLRQQRFEDTFFHLLRLQNQIIESMQIEYGEKIYRQRECFQLGKKALLQTDDKVLTSSFKTHKAFLNCTSETYVTFDQEIGYHFKNYFKSTYHIFKYIYFASFLSKDEKLFYVNTAKAQLSDPELVLIFYNMHARRYGYPKLRFLDQEYDLTEHLGDEDIFNEDHWQYRRIKVDNPFKK